MVGEEIGISNVPSLDQLQAQAGNVGQYGTTFLAWFFGGLAVMILVWWFVHYFFLFKNKMTIYRMTSNNSKLIVKFDLYRYRKSKGKLDIQLRDTGSFLGIGGMTSSIPPSDCLNVTEKGKECCIAIKVSEDELIFPGLNFNAKKIIEPKKSDYEVDGKFDEKEYKKDYVIWKEYVDKLNFQPLTSTDRAYIISEIEDRKSRQSSNIWGLIDKYGQSIIFIVFFVLLAVFWSDITKPNLEMARINVDVLKYQQETAQLQLDVFKAQVKFYEFSTGKTLPADLFPPTRFSQETQAPPK